MLNNTEEKRVFQKVLGDKIRISLLEKRKYESFTKADVAKKVGIKYATLWSWEKGEMHITAYHLYKLANAIELSVLDILPTPEEIQEKLKLANINKGLLPNGLPRKEKDRKNLKRTTSGN